MVKMLILILLTLPCYGVGRTPVSTPYLRIEGHIFFPKINRLNKLLAYTNSQGNGLFIANLKTGDSYRISSYHVGHAFFWAPDGARLFYREVYSNKDGAISELKAYDTYLKNSVSLEKYEGLTSSISLDPRDYRFYILSKDGIKSHKLEYPTERMGTWKRSLKTKLGYWLVAGDRVFWVSNNGISMRPMSAEKSVYSYKISPDGRSIVWATKHERIYLAKDGESPQLLARGTDPSWHPHGKLILFAKAKFIGKKIVSHDISIISLDGSLKDLTRTPGADERFPLWSPKSSSILYTHNMSTDIYEMRFTQ